jgi:hypothetical protein
MTERRRFRQTASLKDRLISFANDMRGKAEATSSEAEREDLLRKARRADTASHIDEWANSPGLRPPK